MDTWALAMEPCRMADSFYHIGVRKGPCYLLETSDGLVLIDTGFPQTLDLILENFRKIGKDPRNVRHILHTHGHYDHVGATRALVGMSGARTYIGAGDEDAVMGKNDLVYAREFGEEFTEKFVPDVILHDGDELNFGDTKIRFVATPGHTAGTMSLFFSLNVNGKPCRAGMFGGAGLNTLTKAYLTAHGLPMSMREDFLRSIDRILGEAVDFHIGNHLSDNHYYQKILRMHERENPFLAENTYLQFLNMKKEQAKKAFADDK